MKLCTFKGDRCVVCGARQINKRQACGVFKPGLGDMVATGLSAVGITKERVSKILGRDCGCPKRQEALNKFGRIIGIGGPLDQPTSKAD